MDPNATGTLVAALTVGIIILVVVLIFLRASGALG